MQVEQLKQFVVEKISDLKGRNIVIIDVKERSSVTQYMVICSGNSKQHVRSIAENVSLELKKANFQAQGIEGKSAGDWVLVDAGSVVVHVMQDDVRDFYQLEKLWSETDQSNVTQG